MPCYPSARGLPKHAKKGMHDATIMMCLVGVETLHGAGELVRSTSNAEQGDF